MPIKLHCPRCAKELSAPDELLGKTVACPRCSERFPVEENGFDEDHSDSKYYPPGTNAFPPGYGPPPADGRSTTPNISTSTAPSSPPPDADGVTPPPVVGPPPTIPPQSDAGPPSPPPIAAAGAPAPPQSAPRKKPTSARFRTEENEAPQPPRRTVKSARFITAGETASHVRLGADGQLPQLQLRQGEQREKPVEEKQGLNPLVLAAVLVSVAMSVAVLLLPTEPIGGVSPSKQAAREEIRKHYTTTHSPIDPKSLNKPYQYYLRLALQANSEGDYATELRNYRHVMDLLHSEGKSEYRGLTGQPGNLDNPLPPSDRHLEQQLSILLSD